MFRPNWQSADSHSSAGWLAFCMLSALDDNCCGKHQLDPPARQSTGGCDASNAFLERSHCCADRPFHCFAGVFASFAAIFLHPEAGYPMRAALMAGAVLLFWQAYRAEFGPVDALSVLAGGLSLDLAVCQGGRHSTYRDRNLGPASQLAVASGFHAGLLAQFCLCPSSRKCFFVAICYKGSILAGGWEGRRAGYLVHPFRRPALRHCARVGKRARFRPAGTEKKPDIRCRGGSCHRKFPHCGLGAVDRDWSVI